LKDFVALLTGLTCRMPITHSTVASIAFRISTALWVVGCPVDDRHLLVGGESRGNGGSRAVVIYGGTSSEDGGMGGEVPIGGQDSAGGTLTGGSGGSNGSGGSGGSRPSVVPTIVDGCVDLNANSIGDCEETLAMNAGFNANTESWTAEVGCMLSWANKNSFGDAPAGSALVAAVGVSDQDGLSQTAATQCLPVTAGKTVQVFANFLIRAGQGDGLASLAVFFYDQADCKGAPRSPILTSRADTGAWATLQGGTQVPQLVTSMQVRLAVTKPYRSEAFEVLFDNVLVRAE